MKKVSWCSAVATLLAIAFVYSCASAPASKIPEWILTRPAPDSTYTYFVGEGSDSNGDVVKATESATNGLIMNILTYIGVTISSTSTAEEKATLDSYSASVTATITAKSENRLAGFMIKEKVVVNSSTSARVDVYILAAYETKELEKEKARIRKVFEERDEAVSIPEAKGRAYESEGRYFDAILKYTEAAVAATGAEIVNSEIKVERNVNNARSVLGRIRIVKINDKIQATVGGTYSEPFKAKIVYGEGDSAPGIPGVQVNVVYTRKLDSGKLGTKTETAMSDAQGIVTFTPPTPDFVGKGKVTMTVNFQSTRDLLEKLPTKYASYRSAIYEDMKGKSVDFEYTVVSNARNVPTGVAIVDFDLSGNVVKGGATQGGVLQMLTTNKFKVQALTIDAGIIADMDDDAILKAAKAFAGKVQRIIVGWARVESSRLDGGMYFVTVRGFAKAYDITTGELLYSIEKSAVGTASDEATATRNAFQQLGQNVFGREFMNNLP
jgi:hypothetical protein